MLKYSFEELDHSILRKIKYEIKKEITWDKITILIDTQEVTDNHKGWHVVEYLQKNGINYEVMKLDVGDFSFIFEDEYFDSIFAIDRKANVNELIGNFQEKRFEREIERAKNFQYFSIAIELGCLDDVFCGNYRSKMNKHAAIGRIITWSNYIQFDFIQGIDFGEYLVPKIYYFLYSHKIIEKLIGL